MSAEFYICNACADDGMDTTMPADEVGAALMQQHLASEHGVTALQFKTCGGCGNSIAVLLGSPAPESCEAHS